MFDKCPENVISNIMEFLNFKDYIRLLSIGNHSLHNMLQDYQWIYIRDCIYRYFPIDIDLFCTFGDNFELKEFLQKTNENVIKNEKTNVFLDFLRKEAGLRYRWTKLLEKYLSNEENRGFVDNVFMFLKEPSLPLMKLRRENVGMYAKSCFQNKLCDVLYEGSSIPHSGFMFNEDLLSFLKNDKEFFLNEFGNGNKDQLKCYRWYIKDADMYAGGMQIENEGFLMNFFEILYDTLIFQLELVNYWLEMQKKPMDLIFQYNTKWNVYVASLSEYEVLFASFIELFNNLYEKECKNYPSFPKYSIFRLMQKLWITKVYTPLESRLLLCFLVNIDYYRCYKLSKALLALDESQSPLNYIDSLFQSHIMSLLEKYLEKQPKYLQNMKKVDIFNYNDFSHFFFKEENISLLMILTGSFVQAVLDLSVNEISVHYLGHSRLETDIAFDKINDLFIEDSIELYKRVQNAFGAMHMEFRRFLNEDYKEIEEGFNERTLLTLKCEIMKICLISYENSIKENFNSKSFNFDINESKGAKFGLSESDNTYISEKNVNTLCQSNNSGITEKNNSRMSLMTEKSFPEFCNINEKSVFFYQLESEKNQLELSHHSEKNVVFIQSDMEKSPEKIPIEIDHLNEFLTNELFTVKYTSFSSEEQNILREVIKSMFSSYPKETLVEKLKYTLSSIDFDKAFYNFLKASLDYHMLTSMKPELDYEIEELNKYRKLPFPLEECEKYFYYPFRTITIPLLEDVYKKYLSNLDTHEHDSSVSQDDLDEYNHSDNNEDSLETYNEEEEELKLSKKNSELLMTPDELPVLKKEKSNKSKTNKACKGLNELEEIIEDKNEIRFFLLDSGQNPGIFDKEKNNSNSDDDDDDDGLGKLTLNK